MIMTDEEENAAVSALLHKILKACDAMPVHLVMTALTRSMATVILTSGFENGYESIIQTADEALRQAVKMGADMFPNDEDTIN